MTFQDQRATEENGHVMKITSMMLGSQVSPRAKLPERPDARAASCQRAG